MIFITLHATAGNFPKLSETLFARKPLVVFDLHEKIGGRKTVTSRCHYIGIRFPVESPFG